MSSACGPTVGGVRHFDNSGWWALHRCSGSLGQIKKLWIDQHDPRAAVIEDIGNCGNIEPDVDRIEHRTAGGHAEMCFGLRGQIRNQGGDDFA